MALAVAVLRRWFCCCWSIVWYTSHCLWEFCVCLCFVMHYVVYILVLQLSWRGRISWLLCYYCLINVLLLLMCCGSSSWCRGLVCSMWLWYFLFIFRLVNVWEGYDSDKYVRLIALTLNILMDPSFWVDTIKLGKSIVHIKGCQVIILKMVY